MRIVQGEEHLRLQQFNAMTARRFFCSACVTCTHHQRRSNPQRCGHDVDSLEGVNPFDMPGVPVYDGVNHPADHPGTAGT